MANQIISHSLAFSRSYIYINIQFVGCLITRRKSRSLKKLKSLESSTKKITQTTNTSRGEGPSTELKEEVWIWVIASNLLLLLVN